MTASRPLPPLPVAHVYAEPVFDRAGAYVGRVRVTECPFCGRPHEHGVPVWGQACGPRLSHCAPALGRDYYVVVHWRAWRPPLPRWRRGR